MSDESLIDRLKESYESLTPKLRKLATYIINNPKAAAFLNSSALAKAAGVSAATVTRLAYNLDLRGYPELRDALQAHAKSVLSLPKYEPSNSKGCLLNDVAAMEKNCIDEMLESIPTQLFNRAVQTLFKARSINVVGTHYNSMPAAYAAYFLQAIRPSVYLFTSEHLDIFTRLQDVGRQDVVLAVSTARYPRDTQKIISLFRNKGATVVAITDSQVSPIIPLADQVMIVPIRFLQSYIDPYAAIMVLIHALVTAVSMKDTQKSEQWIKTYYTYMDYQDYHVIKDMKLN